MNLIIARDLNNGIGLEGNLAWHFKEDLQWFKQVTMGRKLVMGRRTFETLPLLLGRELYVVSKNEGCLNESGNKAKHVTISDLGKEEFKDAFCIGGSMLATSLLDMGLIDRVYLTSVMGEYECDVHFDYSFDDWKVEREMELSDMCKVSVLGKR